MSLTVLAVALAGAVAAAAPAAPSFDCAKARRADEKLVCATPDLAALDRLLAEAYAAALQRAPAAQAEKIRKAQRGWIAGRAECLAATEGRPPEPETAAACLRRDYGRRLSDLARVAAPLPAAVRARAVKWADEARKVEVDIAYPALAPGQAGAAAFDAFFEKKARAWERRARELAADPDVMENAKGGGPPTSVTVSFAVVLATPRVMAVDFSGYEYPSGAAHGLPFKDSTAFDLRAGRPLGERDLFAPGGKKRALELVLRAVRGYGDLEPEEMAAAVSKGAGPLSAWTFRREAVEVTLPVYSIAGYGAGDTPVWLGWDELGPMLRPDAPLPPR